METLVKIQDGKTGATVRYRFYYEKIWNFYNHCKFTQTWWNAVPDRIIGQILAKPQHPPVWVYDLAIRSSVILLLAPSSSQLNLMSDFLSMSVSCLCRNTSVCVIFTNWSLFYNFRWSENTNFTFTLTSGKEKTLISLSL